MPFKELKNVLKKYDLHIQDKSYKSSIKPVEKDGRIYVFDSEGKNLFDYPDSADVDILIFKLEEDLDNLKQKLEEDPDYIEYQRLKEKFGS